MKKLISVMLVLALCAMGCAFAEALDASGLWYLNVIESEGVLLDPALFGMEMVYELKADGSANLSSYGEIVETIKWRMEGENVIITNPAGESLTGRLEDGNMVFEDPENSLVMIYGREKQELQSYVPAQPVSDPTMQQFEGTWNALFIDMMGMQLPMTTLDMKLVVDIAGGSAVVTRNEGGVDVIYTAPVKLENGTLTIEAADDQMPMPLQLQQDGMLVYAEETEGLVMSMYFEKIA